MISLIALAPLAGGVFLGWTLGSNDAANVFGTAVAARVLTYRRATLICALFVILGASLQGAAGIHTLGGLSQQTMSTLVITSLAAAITGTAMTVIRLPISMSQAIVGAIAGIGLATNSMNWHSLGNVVICWVATPLCTMIIAAVFYWVLGYLLTHIPMSMLTRDKILWSGLIVVGSYGSYALGANNVAIATGIFSGQFERLSDTYLALIGGMAIAFGVISYSKRVMLSVGSGIIPLDAFTALVAVASMALTVHVFAFLGVPVSTSQGIIGSIVGIGLIRRSNAINLRNLRNIAFGWLMTPLTALILAAAAYAIFIDSGVMK